MGIGNLKIKDSKLYADISDPRTPDKAFIEYEVPEAIYEEIFARFQDAIDSLPETDEVAIAFKEGKQEYLNSLRKQINYD